MPKKKRDIRKPIKWFIFRIIIAIILNVLFGIWMFVENPVIHEEDVQYYTGTMTSEFSERHKLPTSSQLYWFLVMDNGIVLRTDYSMLKIHPENFVGKTVTVGYRTASDSVESIPLITFSENDVEYLSLEKSQRNVYIVNSILILVSVSLWSIYIFCRYSRIKEDVRILKERREIEKKRQLRQKKREEAQKADLTVHNHRL